MEQLNIICDVCNKVIAEYCRVSSINDFANNPVSVGIRTVIQVIYDNGNISMDVETMPQDLCNECYNEGE